MLKALHFGVLFTKFSTSRSIDIKFECSRYFQFSLFHTIACNFSVDDNFFIVDLYFFGEKIESPWTLLSKKPQFPKIAFIYKIIIQNNTTHTTSKLTKEKIKDTKKSYVNAKKYYSHVTQQTENWSICNYVTVVAQLQQLQVILKFVCFFEWQKS